MDLRIIAYYFACITLCFLFASLYIFPEFRRITAIFPRYSELYSQSILLSDFTVVLDSKFSHCLYLLSSGIKNNDSLVNVEN